MTTTASPHADFDVHLDDVWQVRRIRAFVKDLAAVIDKTCPENREKDLAFVNLGQALTWAIASVDREREAAAAGETQVPAG